MSESKPKLSDEQLFEIIETRLAASDADSGWMVSLLLMRMLPYIKKIADAVYDADLAEDEKKGRIASVIGEIAKTLYRKG